MIKNGMSSSSETRGFPRFVCISGGKEVKEVILLIQTDKSMCLWRSNRNPSPVLPFPPIFLLVHVPDAWITLMCGAARFSLTRNLHGSCSAAAT